jgi:hypothetical protein
MKLKFWPVAHGSGGYSIAHNSPKTMDLVTRERGELSDRHWRSFSSASDPVPAVGHSHQPAYVFGDFTRLYWDFCFALLRASPVFRVAKG